MTLIDYKLVVNLVFPNLFALFMNKIVAHK